MLFFVIGCENPFATRKAEPPTEDRGSWVLPTDPGDVMKNMQKAFQEKNVENYIKCLTDSNKYFQFFPDQYEASNSAGKFELWDLTQEELYIRNLFNSIPEDSIVSLYFSHDIQRDDYPDSAHIRTDYELKLHHVKSEIYPRNAKGQVDFYFIRKFGYWTITRWIDHETQIDTTVRVPSWSTVKANFIIN